MFTLRKKNHLARKTNFSYVVLGIIAKKKSSTVYLAFRRPSTTFRINFIQETSNTDWNNLLQLKTESDSFDGKKSTFLPLTKNQEKRLDRICAKGHLCVLKAVKLCDGDGLDGSGLEKEILQKLKGRNFVKLFDSFGFEGRIFLVMEFFWRGSLRQVIERRGKLSSSTVAYVGFEIFNTILHLTTSGLTHSDLTSYNIMLGQNGLKLIDFGLATRLNQPDHLPNPHTNRGKSKSIQNVIKNSHKSAIDLQYLAILIYEMLTGNSPFGLQKRPENDVNLNLETNEMKFDHFFNLAHFEQIDPLAYDLIRKIGRAISLGDFLGHNSADYSGNNSGNNTTNCSVDNATNCSVDNSGNNLVDNSGDNSVDFKKKLKEIGKHPFFKQKKTRLNESFVEARIVPMIQVFLGDGVS